MPNLRDAPLLLFFCCCALLLVVASGYFSSARSVLHQARQAQHSTEELRAGMASSQLALQHFAVAHARFSQLQPKIEAETLRASLWNKRQLHVNNRLLSRELADAYLIGTAPQAGRFFLVERMNIRVSPGQRSLFIDYRDDDRSNALALTLSGTFYSR